MVEEVAIEPLWSILESSVMSREGFQIPTNLDVAAAGTSQARSATLKYICAECSSKLSLSRTDPVRCKNCGHRILLKARTKRMVQFEAR